jgi:hypothetical protein
VSSVEAEHCPETSCGSASEPAPKRTLFDRLFLGASLLGVLFLVFQAGVLVAVAKLPPYSWFRDGYEGLESYLAQRELLAQPWPQYIWNPADHPERGLVKHEPQEASAGYTLYTSGHEASAILLDMQGNEVYRWTAPFSKVWPPERQGDRSLPDRFVYIRRAIPFPNGDLLALYETPTDTPNGRGLAKLDRRGEAIWTYDVHAHHSLSVCGGGDLYVLAHRLQKFPRLDHPLIEDLIVHLDENGRELDTISILELLVTSPLVRTELNYSDPRGDLTHSNTIRVIPREFADHYQSISPGDLLVCLRNLNLVLVINPVRREIVWGTTGPWYFPHYPEPLPNGNLLIFDNYCMWRSENTSAVIEFDPRARDTVWSFRGEPARRLQSDIRSCQQVLGNGNLLITESDGGRILEVTRAGKIVWEYVNPVRGGDKQELIPIVCGATRYAAEELPFLRTGQPGVTRVSTSGAGP